MPEMQLSAELLEHAYNGGFIACKHIHPHGCTYNSWLKFKKLFRLALAFYAPIHAIPCLIFRHK